MLTTVQDWSLYKIEEMGYLLFYIKLIVKAFNYPLIREHRLREMPLDIWLNLVEKEKFFCIGLTLVHVCVLFKISSPVEFVKSLFKNMLSKLIHRIDEISQAVFLKQNLLNQKTALVKLTQNVLW